MMRHVFLMVLCVAAFLPVVGQQAQPELQTVRVRGFSLQLRERDGKCVLEYGGRHKGELPLGIPAPCQFVPDDKKSTPQHFTYKGWGNPTVLIALGWRPETLHPNPQYPKDCRTLVRGILVRKNGVTLSPEASVGGASYCPGVSLDEKDYNVFASSQHYQNNK
jgi:hypothetical protein